MLSTVKYISQCSIHFSQIVQRFPTVTLRYSWKYSGILQLVNFEVWFSLLVLSLNYEPVKSSEKFKVRNCTLGKNCTFTIFCICDRKPYDSFHGCFLQLIIARLAKDCKQILIKIKGQKILYYKKDPGFLKLIFHYFMKMHDEHQEDHLISQKLINIIVFYSN